MAEENHAEPVDEPSFRVEEIDIPSFSGPITVPTNIPEAAEGIEAIVDLARSRQRFSSFDLVTDAFGPGLPKKVPLIWSHAEGKLVALREAVEAFRIDPARIKGVATSATLDSFVDLIQHHKRENSVVFAESASDTPSLTAVIDYSSPDAPKHHQHLIRYAFPLTEELVAWRAADGKKFTQGEFAIFLEEHAAELAAPTDGERGEYEALFRERFATPAELIQLSRELEVHVSSKVAAGSRLKSGERTIQFVEEHTNTKGDVIDVPGLFMVAIQPFIDGTRIRVPARLRYRISGGEIVWLYQLYRLRFWLREQVKTDLLFVERETGLSCFEGSPEK